jgi:putative hemolysin
VSSTTLSALIDEFIGVPRPVRGIVRRLLGLDQAERLYASLQSSSATPLTDRLLNRLFVTYRVGDHDLRQIPRSGATVIVANHPFGILEGAVLATLLTRIRPDVRFLANQVLSAIPEVRGLLIPISVKGGRASTASNAAGWRRAIQFLRDGGCLVVFPAGEVSRYRLSTRGVTDSQWHSSAARLIEKAASGNVAVSAVPVFIRGANSLAFQILGLLHPRVRTALLLRELLNKKHRGIELRIGSPVPHTKLLEIPTAEERTQYLRWRTYLLAGRHEYKPRASGSLVNRDRQARLDPVKAAADRIAIANEMSNLGQGYLLATADDMQVYCAPADRIPRALAEIGRLREITFRAAGEGTGKAEDLDRFDAAYLHLIAWSAKNREIAGAYRLARTDMTRDLYTATLFRYGGEFLEQMGPALELGRSFVRPEYQKSFAALLALWKGIGAFVARNPRYKMLFGPVSISNQYQAVSRELMVAFLERNASLREWIGLVKNRNPFRRSFGKALLPPVGFDVEELSACVSDLEPSHAGIPVLLRQYLKLGGKLLGFNVDPEFSDTVDGLIVVDLTKTEPRLLERYLGKAEASEFLKYQKGSYEP